MNDGIIKLRVPTNELAEWREKAGKRGLSAWIRERCNGEIPQTEKRDGVAQLPLDAGVRVVEGRVDSIDGSKRVVYERTEKPKGKTCKHGTEKGWHCWQCGGIAVTE